MHRKMAIAMAWPKECNAHFIYGKQMLLFFFFISAKRLKSVHNTAHRVLMHMYLKSHLIGILKCFKWLISLLQPNIHRHTLERKKKLQSLLFMNKWTELIAHWAAAHKNYFLKNLNSFRMNMKRKEEKKNHFYETLIILWKLYTVELVAMGYEQ